MAQSPQLSEQPALSGTGAESVSHKSFSTIIQTHELEKIQTRRQALKDVATTLSPDDAIRPPDKDLVGLAFSGGGIRSATFNLGVLQALAELKILPLVDYLSTVSGGGYIGGWWSSWMLRRAGSSRRWLPEPTPGTSPDEPPEVEHLRLYSNYLIPRKGLFSPDTWRAVTVVLRNLVVTQVVMAALLGAALLLVDGVYIWRVPGMLAPGGALVADRVRLIWGIPLIGFAVIWWVLTVVFLCVANGDNAELLWLRTRITQIHAYFAGVVAFLVGLFTLAGFSDLLLAWLNKQANGKGGWLAVLPGIASAIYAAFAKAPAGGGDVTTSLDFGVKKYALKLAPVLALLTLAMLLAGGAWKLLRATNAYMINQAPREPDWVLAISLLAVFGVSQIYFLRSLAAQRLGWRDFGKRDPQDAGIVAIALSLFACGFYLYESYAARHAEAWWTLLACFLVLAQLAIGAGFASDPNALSLHSFYYARLVRAYLGATNSARLDDLRAMKDEVSDPKRGDDMPLYELAAWNNGGPVHILNTTLNLVGAKDLTVEQREAEVFELTPLFCGSDRTGYRPTNEYVDGRLTLGTAVAISGAAASTNMGSNTTVPLAMLMSFFNVRLGYWIANPGAHRAWRYPWTRFWLWYQLREMLGQTTAQGKFSFLSDGGHLENLGLYGLVKRRCRYIIVCDAGADPSYRFGDLATAIRMVRIDFRCEVKLDLTNLRPIAGVTDPYRHSRMHYAVGHIHYPDGPPASTLIYLKSSLTDSIPADIQSYAQTHCPFPHQTTADQFFDEAQFESYRRLGYEVAKNVFDSTSTFIPEAKERNREQFFDAAQRKFEKRVADLRQAPTAGS